MSFLEEIWYGNVSPYEAFAEKDSEYSSVLKKVVSNEERIKGELTEKGKEILAAFTDMQRELMCIGTKDAFIYGVRYGVKVVAEALGSTLSESA